MDCKPNSLKISYALATFLISPCLANAGFHIPALTNQKSAMYDFRPTEIQEASSENLNTLMSSAVELQNADLTVGVSIRNTPDLRLKAQRMLESLQGIFASPAGQMFFREFPDVTVDPAKIYSDTGEVVLSMSTTGNRGISAAKQSLIQILSRAPSIKFAGETRTISVD